MSVRALPDMGLGSEAQINAAYLLPADLEVHLRLHVWKSAVRTRDPKNESSDGLQSSPTSHA